MTRLTAPKCVNPNHDRKDETGKCLDCHNLREKIRYLKKQIPEKMDELKFCEGQIAHSNRMTTIAMEKGDREVFNEYYKRLETLKDLKQNLGKDLTQLLDKIDQLELARHE